jgi:hypothetical protein
MAGKKICDGCLENKTLSEYYRRSSDNKLYNQCIQCCLADEKKQCSRCERVKPFDDFYKNQTGKRSICKECEKARKKRDYVKNKEHIRKQQKGYYDKNRDKILEQKQEYYELNKDTIIEKFRIRYNADPKFRLYTCIRRRTRDFLRTGQRYGAIIGCSYDKLVKWFEFNFELDSHMNMSWDNMGNIWQIDHVYALSKLSLIPEDEHYKYYSWKNLRPVDKKYNLLKSNTIKQNDLFLLEIRIKIFEKKYKEESEKELEENEDIEIENSITNIDVDASIIFNDK